MYINKQVIDNHKVNVQIFQNLCINLNNKNNVYNMIKRPKREKKVNRFQKGEVLQGRFVWRIFYMQLNRILRASPTNNT